MSDEMIIVDHVNVTYKLVSGNIKSLKEWFLKLITRKLSYNYYEAIKDVSFSVNKGEIVGLIGENGAGKSTLLKVIAGILKPTKGSVTCNGKVVPMLELGCGFDTELTGKENIYLNGAVMGFKKEFLDQHLDEIIEFSELGDFINQPLRTYSSGMMMRLGFSIATCVHPDILICDEILAVGDDKFQIKSKNRMLELMKGGTTVLFVSHSIDAIRSICDRVVWIENGYVKKAGDVESVTAEYVNR